MLDFLKLETLRYFTVFFLCGLQIPQLWFCQIRQNFQEPSFHLQDKKLQIKKHSEVEWTVKVMQQSFIGGLQYIALLSFLIFPFLVSTVNIFLYYHKQKQYNQTIFQKKQYCEIVYCMTGTLNLLFCGNQSSILQWSTSIYSLLSLSNGLNVLAKQGQKHCGMKTPNN